VYIFFWRYKYWLSGVILLLFGICLYQLSNAKIYFDSERIINELETSNVDLKIVDDNNLIFFGVSFNDSLEYSEFTQISNFHKSLKKSPYVNRVFSIINERKVVNMGLYPMPKKVLKLTDENRYKNSIKSIQNDNSNFITPDFKNLLFLIEAKKELTKEQTRELIQLLYDSDLTSTQSDVFVAGRSPSELYFEKKVIVEFITITIVSGLLCFFFLFLITQNIKLVMLTVCSVIMSIVTSLGISQILFGGIELVMIITPAILFIVCISDIMHLSNKQENIVKDKEEFFLERMDKVGKAVVLTSLTTGMSFLTFLLNDILPILRFGIITSIGVLFTLLVAVLVYAISIDKNFHLTRPTKKIGGIFESLLAYFSKPKRSPFFHFLVSCFIGAGLFALFSLNIDNYLTDEINKKSEVYQQTNYFDKNFGGIKPLTIVVNQEASKDELIDIQNNIINLGFVIDFNSMNNPSGVMQKIGIVSNDFENSNYFVCRSGDEGSLVTLDKLSKLESMHQSQGIDFSYSGAGYLFDLLANDLTKQLIYGLLLAILSIGFVFFILNKFDFNYFIIALTPNIIPILVSLGILNYFDFYFSLSNAFIFTIVFGLIVDDSIHVISAYSNNRKRGIDKATAIKNVVNQTGLAVVKTTFVVIVCLLPLAVSEFKSVSQLSVITILSAIIAVFFDLIYLPRILKRLTK